MRRELVGSRDTAWDHVLWSLNLGRIIRGGDSTSDGVWGARSERDCSGRGDVAVSGLAYTGGGLEPPRPTFCPAMLTDRLSGVHKMERRTQLGVEGGLGMTLQSWLALLSSSPYPVLTGSATCSGFGHPEGIMQSSCPGGTHAQVGEMPRKPEMRSQRVTVSVIE